MTRLTNTQAKILNLLNDGRLHTREEIHSLLPDTLGDLSNIKAHISDLRKILWPLGRDIVCVFGFQRRLYYRQVRLLGTAD